MDRQGPRHRGGVPPGRYGGGNDRREMVRMDRDIDDDPMDMIGGHWEDHALPNPREGMRPGRQSARGDPQGRRGAGSRDMNDLMDDMEIGPSDGNRHAGSRRARDRGASPTDDILDSVESHHDFERNAVAIGDLAMLRESRNYMMEKWRNVGGPGTGEERKRLRDNLIAINGDIAELEDGERERGGVPYGMKDPMDSMHSNSRQSYYQGGSYQEGIVGTMNDVFHYPGESSRRGERGDYSDEESKQPRHGSGHRQHRSTAGRDSDEESEYQPHGSSRSQHQSTAGRGRHSRR